MRKRVRAKGTPPPLPTTLLALAITLLGPNLYDSKFWLTGKTFRFIEPVAASFAAADLQVSNIFTADSKTMPSTTANRFTLSNSQRRSGRCPKSLGTRRDL
jgi:hypothetical protein